MDNHEQRYDLLDIEGTTYAKPNKKYWNKISEKIYNLRVEKSNIPKFFREIEFSDYVGEKSFENIEKLQYMIEHIKDDKFKDINLYLWGTGNSTQKTASACNFAKGCIKKGLTVRYMNFGVLVNYLMKTQGFKQDSDVRERLRDLRSADILLLDDCFDPKKSLLWKGENRGMIISEIDSFFRELTYNYKRCVLTSNLSLASVKENYGISMYKLIDRNFVQMQFLDSVEEVRKFRLEDVWEDMK